MSIKRIPLSRLETDLRNTLNECLDSGQSLIVELPDHRLVSIQAFEPDEADDLVDRLIETNPAFRAVGRQIQGKPPQAVSGRSRRLSANV